VLHINTERTWRGGEQQVVYLLRGLAERGVTQELVCQPDSILARRALASGLPVAELSMRGELDLPAVGALARRMRANGTDLVHMHTSHAVTLGVAAAWWAGRRGGPDGAGRPATLVSRRVDFSIHKRRLLSFSRAKYTRGVDRIICVSEGIRAVLIADGLAPERVGVVHSGVDLARFRDVTDRRAEYAREFGFPLGVPLIGNVAHLAGHKGQRDLVAAAALVLRQVPEARFLIVGEGECRAALEAQVAELGLQQRVLLVGFRTDVPALLAAFDIFCFPSHLEGLGTSVLDALASGRPVVATRAGGIPEMIEDGRHGLLVPPRDPAALAAALLRLLEQREFAQSLGRAGRQRVEQEFSSERTTEGTLREYEQLLARRAAAHRAGA